MVCEGAFRGRGKSRRPWIMSSALLSILAFGLMIVVPGDGLVVTSVRRDLSPRPFGSAHSRPARKQSQLNMATKSGGKNIVSYEEFSQSVMSATAPRPVMVFFTAPWCGPCRLSIPVVKEVMKEYAGQVDLVEVCTDDLPDVAADAGVVSIPTIQMYHQGELLDTIVGCVARKVLGMAVGKVLDDLSAEITQE